MPAYGERLRRREQQFARHEEDVFPPTFFAAIRFVPIEESRYTPRRHAISSPTLNNEKHGPPFVTPPRQRLRDLRRRRHAVTLPAANTSFSV